MLTSLLTYIPMETRKLQKDTAVCDTVLDLTHFCVKKWHAQCSEDLFDLMVC